MKFETDKKEKTDLPIAFIDDAGNLWFRTTDESNVMDNKVSIIRSNNKTIFDDFKMDNFVSCVSRNERGLEGNYAVKKFYEGDTLTITF